MVVALTPLVSPATFAKLVVHFLDQMAHFRTSNYGQIYLRALAMIQSSPWTGMGVDGFRQHCLDPVFIQGSAMLGVPSSQISAAMGCNIHPHSYWLDVTVSGGLPALAMFAALAVLWLRGIARGPAVLDDPLRIALTIGAAIVLWPLASTSSLFVADTGGWVMLTLGWGLAAAADAATEKPSPGSSSRADRAPP
jgi:O-antigen ligase